MSRSPRYNGDSDNSDVVEIPAPPSRRRNNNVDAPPIPPPQPELLDTTDPAFNWELDLAGAPDRLFERLSFASLTRGRFNRLANEINNSGGFISGIPIFESCLKHPHNRQLWMNSVDYNSYHLWLPGSPSEQLNTLLGTFDGSPRTYEQDEFYRTSPEWEAIRGFEREPGEVRSVLYQDTDHHFRLYVHTVTSYYPGVDTNEHLYFIIRQLPFLQLQFTWDGAHVAENDSDRSAQIVYVTDDPWWWTGLNWIHSTLYSIDLLLQRGCEWENLYEQYGNTERNVVIPILEQLHTRLHSGYYGLHVDDANITNVLNRSIDYLQLWIENHGSYLLNVYELVSDVPDKLVRYVDGTQINAPFDLDDYVKELTVAMFSVEGTKLAESVVWNGRISVFDVRAPVYDPVSPPPQEQVQEEEHEATNRRSAPNYELSRNYDAKMADRYQIIDDMFDPLFDIHTTCKDVEKHARSIEEWLNPDSTTHENERNDNIIILGEPAHGHRWGTHVFCFTRSLLLRLYNQSDGQWLRSDEDRDRSFSQSAIQLPIWDEHRRVYVHVPAEDLMWAIDNKHLNVFQIRLSDLTWHSRITIEPSSDKVERVDMPIFRLRGVRQRDQGKNGRVQAVLSRRRTI